jgi:hypothetical protein
MDIQNSNQAGPSNTGTKRFVVQRLALFLFCAFDYGADNDVDSSDVIQDMRVNVSEEISQKVIWYKVCTFFFSSLSLPMTMQGKVSWAMTRSSRTSSYAPHL